MMNVNQMLATLEWFEGGAAAVAESSEPEDVSVQATDETITLSLQDFLDKIDAAKPLSNFAAKWSPLAAGEYDLVKSVVNILKDNGMESLAEEFGEDVKEAANLLESIDIALKYVTFDLAAFAIVSSSKPPGKPYNGLVIDEAGVFGHKDRNEPLPDPVDEVGMFQKAELIHGMELADQYRFDFKDWKVIEHNQKIESVTLEIASTGLAGTRKIFTYGELMKLDIKLIGKGRAMARFMARKDRVLAHVFGQKKPS